MNLIHINALNELQKKETSALAEACKAKEPLALSAPSEDGLDYFLLYEKDQSGLLGFAFLFFPQETACECAVFVHPDHRRRGYCLRILDSVLEYVEEYEKKNQLAVDFCFLTDEKTPSAMAVMENLEAEYWYSEYKMVRPLKEKDRVYTPQLQIQQDESGLYTAVLNDTIIGTCSILPSGQEFYLYAFQIKEEYQGQGYGKDFLSGMLAILAAEGGTVSLQVSGQNYIARNLYKKTGFKTTESLSYYIY